MPSSLPFFNSNQGSWKKAEKGLLPGLFAPDEYFAHECFMSLEIVH